MDEDGEKTATAHDLEVLKRAVLEEFGLLFNNPDELREYVTLITARMNAAERAAFTMQLGRISNEIKAGSPPKARSMAMGSLILIAVAWFIWRPLAAFLAIFTIAGNVRRFAIGNEPYWHPSAAMIVGALYGIFLAFVVRVGTISTAYRIPVGLALGALGFLGAGYIGYRQVRTIIDSEANRRFAQAASVLCYLAAVVTLFLTKFPS